MVIDEDFYLSLALKEAWKYQGLTYPNPAVGCAIVHENGQLLSIEAHQKAGFAHAELLAVKSALKKLNPNLLFPTKPNELYDFILKNHNYLLKNAHIFVTLEPCSHQGKTPSCALLLKALQVKKVVIGTKDNTKLASGGADILRHGGIRIEFSQFNKKYYEILEPFLAWQEDNFTFFKLAMSANGVIDGGIITSKESRIFTHKLRNLCNLLVIGGNTVRMDRPTLDARMCKGKAPNILIYSKRNDFDTNIPLFNVPNRHIRVANTLTLNTEEKMIMIEGGEGTLRALKNRFTWLLLFHSPHFKKGISPQINQSYTLLYQGKTGEDSYGWYKKIDG